MTKQSELLAFLTNEENLPFVVSILRQGDQIRKLLSTRFLTELARYLKEHVPPGVNALGSKTELCVREADDEYYGAVVCWNTQVAHERQSLRVEIQHSEEEGCEVTLCVAWADPEMSEESKLQKLKSITRLGEHLKARGMKKGTWWFRYKSIREHDSVDEFLESIVDGEEREAVFRLISSCFWPLVQDIAPMLAEANEEIARIRQK